MMKYARQVAVSGITGSDLMEYVLPIPPLNEQGRISSVLRSISNAIDEKKKTLQTTTALKKALMQDLLTGKVRVKVTRHDPAG
jgi:type I restriction enzyme S subunit